LASSTPATSLKVILFFLLVQHAGAALAKAHGAFARHLDLAEDEKVQQTHDKDEERWCSRKGSFITLLVVITLNSPE